MKDDLLLSYLRYISEGQKALARIGLKDSSLRILYCLYADRRAWTVSALAEATDLTRVTVRARLKGFAEKGFVSYGDDGVRLTDEGVERLHNIFDEFFEEVWVHLIKFHRVLHREHRADLKGSDRFVPTERLAAVHYRAQKTPPPFGVPRAGR